MDSVEQAVGYMAFHLEALGRQTKINTILDIGAAHGHFSHMAQRIWPDVRVTAVECNPRDKKYLEDTNWAVHYACLGDKECKKTFYVNPLELEGGGSSFYIENTTHFDNCIEEEMDIITLDSLDLLPHDLIKIDTQGSELDIMKGGEKTLANARFLLLELSYIDFNQGAPLIDDILAYTREQGFRMIDVFGPQFGGHWWQGRKTQADVLLAKEDEDVFNFRG